MRSGFGYAALALCWVGLGCRSDAPEPAKSEPIPEPEETESPDPKPHMQEHLRTALAARDAVIAGDLERAKTALDCSADTFKGAVRTAKNWPQQSNAAR